MSTETPSEEEGVDPVEDAAPGERPESEVIQGLLDAFEAVTWHLSHGQDVVVVPTEQPLEEAPVDFGHKRDRCGLGERLRKLVLLLGRRR